MEKLAVTGCSGFIGSHLVQRLLSYGVHVVGIDNLSTGNKSFLDSELSNPNFEFINSDILDIQSLEESIEGCDAIYHLAANADVRFGIEDTKRDLNQNTVGTYNVLEASRKANVKKIIFSSTGSIYGEAPTIPTPENCALPVQTSLYGASKLAGEGLIQAYCESFDMKCWIFRFVSILGERYTHGHVYDFYKQLMLDPNNLHILGDGKQRKSYLYIHDCIDAIETATKKSQDKVNIFNLGSKNYCEVWESANWIIDELNIKPNITFGGGRRGWIGDNPFIFLDTKKINSLGWDPKLSIEESVRKTVRFLKKNEWVFDARG